MNKLTEEEIKNLKTSLERITDETKVIVEGDIQYLNLLNSGLVKPENIINGSNFKK